ncbi:MAG: hypothetical protein [Bacteriophage sp.]|nr:MAG: hypothetical protein [Bacteriophage sp.]
MKRIKKSFVAWSLLATLVSFPVFYFLLPYERFLDLALAIAFGVCLSATIRYGRDAIVSLRSGRTGAEFLIVAVFAIVSVLLGQRIWGIVLRVLDRPDWLVNSPVTIFVPWMLSWAISLALIAPDVDLEPDDARSGIWRSAALFIGGALAGFVIASSFGARSEQSALRSVRMASLPSCASGQIVGTGNKTYHTAESRYRYLVVPRKCFNSEYEAKKAGYVGVK